MSASATVETVWGKAQQAEALFWSREALQEDLILERLGRKVKFNRFLRPYLKDVRTPRLLEVGIGGFGLGCLAPFLGQRFQITAVDPLPLVEVDIQDPDLKTYFSALRQRVEFHQSPGESLPFSDNQFGAVACDNVLDHCQLPEKILTEIWRVLEPGGLFFFSINTFSLLGRFRFELNRRIRPGTIHVYHPYSYTHARMERILRRQGWTLVQSAAPGFVQARAGGSFVSCWVCRKAG